MDLPELELLVEPDNPHSPGHSFTALENSALLASSESSPHLSLLARTPTMSQDDSAPTELRYTASIEPQVAFPCYFGTHDGYAYQDWYVPAVVLTGTASPSLRDSPLVPFSCQGPAYARIYPTPYLNELRRDAIAADFEIPTAGATHTIPGSLSQSSLPDLVYPSSTPTSSISSTPPLISLPTLDTLTPLDTTRDSSGTTCSNIYVDDALPASLLFAAGHDGEGDGSGSEAEEEWERVVNTPTMTPEPTSPTVPPLATIPRFSSPPALLTLPTTSPKPITSIIAPPATSLQLSTLPALSTHGYYRELVSRYPRFYDNLDPEPAVVIHDCIKTLYPEHHPSLYGYGVPSHIASPSPRTDITASTVSSTKPTAPSFSFTPSSTPTTTPTATTSQPTTSAAPSVSLAPSSTSTTSKPAAPDEPRFNVPATIVAPIPVPADNDLSILRSFQAECERVLVD
ncbi:hypothetical protein L227DRAFT_618116, partial [Lentinus tigrinus ALCF2SS1-6]